MMHSAFSGPSRRLQAIFTVVLVVVVFLIALPSPNGDSHSFLHIQRRNSARVVRQEDQISVAPIPTLSSEPSPSLSSQSHSSHSPSVTSLTSFSSSSPSSVSSVRTSSRSASSPTSSILSTTVESSSITTAGSSDSTSLTSSTIISSSSSRSVSSSASLTSQISRTSSSLFNPTPGTTLILTGDVAETATSIFHTLSYEPSASVTETPVSAAGNTSFWDNKGAIIGTFIVVAVVGVGIIAAIVVVLLKRRSNRHQDRIHHDLLGTYPEAPVERTRTRSDSPGPSINAAPMDPFETREVRSSQPIFAAVGTSVSQGSYYSQDHLAYPAGTAYSDDQGQHSDYANYYDYTLSLPPNTEPQAVNQYTPSHPCSIPPPAVGTASPVASRDPVGRDSAAYQPSIDSFYGAAGQPSGYTHPL